MKPAVLLQIFRRHGPWLTYRGWAMVGGLVALGALALTLWR